jgi:dTDP-4-dehydrorhamnose 3,5-epimerase
MYKNKEVAICHMKLVTRLIHFDKRGHFEEIFRANDFGSEVPQFIQDNLSYSNSGVLRGMHFQDHQWQLLTVLKGSILDVTIDINRTSQTFLKTNVVEMHFDSDNQLLIPPGVAHGFCVISNEAVLHYKSSVLYGDSKQHGISWDSEQIREFWPKETWELSARDSSFPQLDEFLSDSEA